MKKIIYLAVTLSIVFSAELCYAITPNLDSFNNILGKTEQEAITASATVSGNGALATPAEKTTMEEKIMIYYSNVQGGCDNQLTTLETKRDAFTKRKTGITAWGSLVTLIGGVTVYAPAKAVLMGVGITAGNDSSVLGGLAGSASSGIALTQSDIDNLKKSYSAAASKLDGKNPTNDPTGADRIRILIALKAACAGLATFLDTNSGT